MIQKEVERQRLTYKEFGTLIHKNEKTIPDIYGRESMSIDLLITISCALKKDFLNPYYAEGQMKELRDDEVSNLNNRLQGNSEQIQKLSEENMWIQKELTLTQHLVNSQKDTIAFAKEQIDLYKLRLAELSTSQKNANQSH